MFAFHFENFPLYSSLGMRQGYGQGFGGNPGWGGMRNNAGWGGMNNNAGRGGMRNNGGWAGLRNNGGWGGFGGFNLPKPAEKPEAEEKQEAGTNPLFNMLMKNYYGGGWLPEAEKKDKK